MTGLYFIHINIFILIINIISFILLILSISSISIYQYPPDAFYYFSSLPLLYWIGFSLVTIVIINILLNRYKFPQRIHILSLILFAMYLYGIPNIIHEYSRYMDVYDHGADLYSLVNTGYIPQDNSYAREYPILFILTAILFNIMNIDLVRPFIFFKLFNILTMLFIVILLYIFASKIIYFKKGFSQSTVSSSYIYSSYIDNNIILVPFAFMCLNWTHIGHFAPHTLSFILYIIFLINLIYALNNTRRNYIVISIILILVINMTNPTNATMLFLNLSALPFIILVLSNKNINKAYKITCLLLLFMLITWLGWTSYNGENVALLNAKRYTNEFLERVGDLSKIKLPASPNESFYLTSNLRIIQTLFVFIGIISFLYLLIRKRIFDNIISILLALTVIMPFITIIMFASDVLLTRIHVYMTLTFALMSTYLISNILISSKIKYILVLVVAGWSYITNITLYASDAHTYLDASLLYTVSQLHKHFTQYGTINAYSVANFGSLYYDSLDGQHNLTHRQYADLYDKKYRHTHNINEISSRFIIDKTNFVLFSKVDENRLIMRNNDNEFYILLKDNLASKRFNRISDVSTTTIFIFQS